MSETEVYPGVYQHFKEGKLYYVSGVAIDANSENRVVVYHPLYPNEHNVFTRDEKDFVAIVEKNGYKGPRFLRLFFIPSLMPIFIGRAFIRKRGGSKVYYLREVDKETFIARLSTDNDRDANEIHLENLFDHYRIVTP